MDTITSHALAKRLLEGPDLEVTYDAGEELHDIGGFYSRGTVIALTRIHPNADTPGMTSERLAAIHGTDGAASSVDIRQTVRETVLEFIGKRAR